MKPYRFQIRRVKGWKKPANSMIVARPGQWGNPFPINEKCSRDESVAKFDKYLQAMDPTEREEFLAPLRGKNLGCWCRLSDKCHADVLLKWANQRQ